VLENVESYLERMGIILREIVLATKVVPNREPVSTQTVKF